jgi:ABC-type polysaccharide/polyol phosphate export permease
MGEARRITTLAAHLARREATARHRFTLLGWLWPLARQLAQLGVLLIVFTSFVDLGIEDYAPFLFTGLVAWTWFSQGLTEATWSVLAHRHLVFRPRCPAALLPVVAVGVALIDVLIALPVLFVMVAATGNLAPSLLFVPVLALIQLVLVCGLGWACAALSVYVRDVTHLVVVSLLLLFYLTPVFYDADRIPDDYEWALNLNPLTPLVEGYRDVLLAGELPPAGGVLAVAGVSLAVAIAGFALFQRLRPGFVDEL